jgi:phosphatidylglycerol:prolipoprotein diacylglycerol transferase
MIRELFHIGPVSISPFGVMLMLAFLAAYAQLAWGLRRTGAGEAEDASSLMLWGGLAGIAGGKVYYAILYGDWRLLFDRAGIVWYGGFIGGAAAILWIIHRRRLAAWSAADAAAPALALGYVIGRVGCFLVGDDYGVPTDKPWGVVFPVGPTPTRAGLLEREFGVELPPGTPADALVPVHPTQLYEVAMTLPIWALGCWMLVRGARPGRTVLVVVALLAVERFIVEIFRAKDDRFFGAFTLAQLISALLLATVGAFWAWHRRRGPGAQPSPA